MGMRKALPVAAAVALLASPAAAAADDPPPAAVAAVDEVHADILESLSDPSEAAAFGFSPPLGTITIGQLRPSYGLSHPRHDGSSGPSLSERLEFAGEWVAVVYEDGVATNVVGIWEEEPGRFEISTFGYGTSVAKGLHAMPADHLAVYEGPRDTWYEVTPRRVTLISGDVHSSDLGETMGWTQFTAEYDARVAAAVPDGTGTDGPESAWQWAGRVAGLLGAVAVVVVGGRRRASQRRAAGQRCVVPSKPHVT